MKHIIYQRCQYRQKINRIKTVLVDLGKTNKWLAEQLGKDPTTVSKWCTNSCQPSLEMMMTIAKLLGVERNDLVRLEEDPDIVAKEQVMKKNNEVKRERMNIRIVAW